MVSIMYRVCRIETVAKRSHLENEAVVWSFAGGLNRVIKTTLMQHENGISDWKYSLMQHERTVSDRKRHFAQHEVPFSTWKTHFENAFVLQKVCICFLLIVVSASGWLFSNVKRVFSPKSLCLLLLSPVFFQKKLYALGGKYVCFWRTSRMF